MTWPQAKLPCPPMYADVRWCLVFSGVRRAFCLPACVVVRRRFFFDKPH